MTGQQIEEESSPDHLHAKPAQTMWICHNIIVWNTEPPSHLPLKYKKTTDKEHFADKFSSDVHVEPVNVQNNRYMVEVLL